MKRLYSLWVLLALLPALGLGAQETAPAFPGAEGAARYTTSGGRGGAVYHVTTLADSGTGSLREALGKSGARTIVFDVAGYIDLKSDLRISNGNVTVAGQTAPAPGITLRYYTINCTADNVIIRFIRFRRSQVKSTSDGGDAIWGRQKKNIILDHCSMSWGCDEVASFYDNRNFSMQWCTIAESLCNAGHSKGAHGYGGIWGGKNASFHHCLLAHLDNRVPRFNGARYNWSGYDTKTYANTVQAERVDYRNCVVYNWGSGGCYGGPGGGYVNMVNNYYKYGPGTKNKTRVTQMSAAASGNSEGAPDYLIGMYSRYFIQGNYVTAGGASAANYDWKGVVSDGGKGEKQTFLDPNNMYGLGDSATVSVKLSEPIAMEGAVTTHAAVDAYEKVLLYAGASLYRDAVDARYVEEARTGTATYKGTEEKTGQGKTSGNYNRPGIIDRINDPDGEQNAALASFPELVTASRETGFDTDMDGMPDAWETLNGLNPLNPNDGKQKTLDTEKGWYTNLEVYLNSLVEDIVKAGNEAALTAVEEYYPACKRQEAETPDALEQPLGNQEVLSVQYFSLDGKALAEPAEGINIRRTTYADGKVFSDLVMKRN